MNKHKIIKKAGELYRLLEIGTRTNGGTFVRVKDGAPKWTADVCFAAHNGESPNDFAYDFIHTTCNVLMDCDPSDDLDFNDLQFEAPFYNAEKLRWVSETLDRAEYVDNAMADGANTLYSAIDRGWDLWAYEIFQKLVRALGGVK